MSPFGAVVKISGYLTETDRWGGKGRVISHPAGKLVSSRCSEPRSCHSRSSSHASYAEDCFLLDNKRSMSLSVVVGGITKRQIKILPTSHDSRFCPIDRSRIAYVSRIIHSRREVRTRSRDPQRPHQKSSQRKIGVESSRYS